MSPNSVLSSFRTLTPPPAPPAPSPVDANGPGSADSANQPGRSFRKVLDEQSNRSEPKQAESKGKPDENDPAKKGDPAEGESSDAKTTDADGTAKSDGATPDGKPQKTAAGKAVAGKQSPKVSGKKETSADPDETGESSDATADTTASQPALAMEESAADPVDEKQLGDGKKDHKPDAAAVVADGSQAAALAATAATSSTAPTDAAKPAPTQQNGSTAGAEQQVAPQLTPPAADSNTGKAVATSNLRAEQAVQPAKAGKGSAQQNPANVSAKIASTETPAISTTTDQVATAVPVEKSSDRPTVKADAATFQQQLVDAIGTTKTADSKTNVTQASVPVPAPTAADFAAANHAQIVNSVHTQLLPNGGSMQIRLDPPDLGAMQISVRMRDGVMTAEFQTSNEQTAKLLSHSLGDLKTQLESQGVTVEKLHVTSAPQESNAKGGDSDSRHQRDQTPSDDQRREQQRKEMLRRMWSKLSNANEPFDMVA